MLRSLKNFSRPVVRDDLAVPIEIAKSSQEAREPLVGTIISAYLPNENARKLLRVAIESVLAQSHVPLSVWVVSTGSPTGVGHLDPLEFPQANFVSTDYFPMAWEHQSLPDFAASVLRLPAPYKGSTANGWGLDLGLKVMSENISMPRYILTLQMDIMFTRRDSILQMVEKFSEGVACVGMLEQLSYGKRHRILHSECCMWDSSILLKLGVGFEPDFPEFDVGEKAVHSAIEQGHKAISFKNIRSNPEITLDVDEYGRFQDVAVDDEGHVTFIHLGRGIPKSVGAKKGPVSVDEWIRYFEGIDMRPEPWLK